MGDSGDGPSSEELFGAHGVWAQTVADLSGAGGGQYLTGPTPAQ